MRPLLVVEEGVGQAEDVVGHDLGETPEGGSLDVHHMVVGVEGVGPWATDNKDMGELGVHMKDALFPALALLFIQWRG